MKTALVVNNQGINISSVIDFLKEEGFTDITLEKDSAIAMENPKKEDFDLILINSAAVAVNEERVASYFAAKTKACVVVIAPKEQADEMSDELSPNGVLVISRPINKHLFHHYLQFTEVFKRRMLGIWKENYKLKHMVEEIKVTDRAKYLLMQCLSMSEEQAHQYLQKQAMDMRLTKYEVALSIIRTYS